MSETLNHGNRRESFETEDLSPQGVFYFMAGLAVLGVVIYFILVGMYRFLDAYDRNHQPPVNPMSVQTGVDPQTMKFPEIRDKLDQSFPKPVLEYNERTQFIEEIDKEDKALASYDWVDQKNGVARIPIDRAMDLLVQRGLPVLPQNSAKNQPPPAGKSGTQAKPTAETDTKSNPKGKTNTKANPTP
jgi:hypothetical protein